MIERHPPVARESGGPAEPTQLEIYLGAAIRPASERAFLEAVLVRLQELDLPSIVIANVHLGGRQIDFVIATEHAITVVEVKSSFQPIRGDLNGAWSRRDVSGEWRFYPNAYEQALSAKNAFRDAMTARVGASHRYPGGHVVFVGGIPLGSSLTPGDFKVSVTDLASFVQRLPTSGEGPFSLTACRDLARSLNLARVSVAVALSPPELSDLHEIAGDYRRAFVNEYAPRANRWLADSPSQEDAVSDALNRAGCYVRGPSGCGKTLLAQWVATELARRGHPVLFLAAKDFAGSWRDLIRKEIAYLVDHKPDVVTRAFAVSDLDPIIVVDGLNEFGSQRTAAIRGIKALVRRFNARLLLTSQEPQPAEFSALELVEVPRPTLELKRRIAAANGGALTLALTKSLEAVASGLEAELLGRVGADLAGDATRIRLLDRFARERLGNRARSASFGLRRLANQLHSQIAFSIAEVDFDELMVGSGVSFEDCDVMLSTGLLVRRGGRVSFSHEMFRNAFAAFDLARSAGQAPAALAALLTVPLYEPLARDIIAAIDDADVCKAVLEQATSAPLLAAAAEGELGAQAETVANCLLDEVAAACAAEIKGARLVLTRYERSVRVEWSAESQRHWSEVEEARLSAVGYCSLSSRLRTYMQLCGEMDATLDRERRHLADEARQLRFPLRSQSFALAYYGFGNRLGFYFMHHAQSDAREGDGRAALDNYESLSSGQLHFVIENRYAFFSRAQSEELAEVLISALTHRFRWEPYHVRLALLHAAGFVRGASESTIARLVAAIQALDVNPGDLGINSSIVDALKLLGALDEESEGNRAHIREEIASAIEDAGANDVALSVCISIFDHPFDSIYAEEIFGLDAERRRALYRKAISASDARRSASLSWLVEQVIGFGDPTDGPLIEPMAALPDRQNIFPQEQWRAFVLATRFLGRHGLALPLSHDDSAAANCLLTIRTILYAAESGRPHDLEAGNEAWLNLRSYSVALAIGCLAEVESTLSDRHWGEDEQSYPRLSMVELYPAQCLGLARRFVAEAPEAQYYQDGPIREIGPTFAFSVVGRLGDRSDLPRLRQLSRAHRFSRHALEAIGQLDGAGSVTG